jgi:hypothetical protein
MMATPDVVPPLIPEHGFQPEDFPQVTVVQIPYTSNTGVRPDPIATIGTDGWLFIETGNVRIAIPDRIQWGKLVYLVEALWNSHELSEKEKIDDDSSTDEPGQPEHDVPGVDQQRPRDEVSSSPEAATNGSISEPANGHNRIWD